MTSSSDAGTDGLDAGSPSKTGQVTLQQISLSGLPEGTLTATFGTSATMGCTHAVEGSCTIDLCSVSASATSTTESAGALMLSGPTVGNLRVSPTLVPSPRYSQVTGAFWRQPNETVTVAAEGGAVPAFTQTISAPSAVTITQPTCSASTTCVISRAAPFTVSWTGGTVGSVQIRLVSEQGTAPTSTVSCLFPAAAGTATIPATVMGALLSGTGSILVGATTSSTLVAGDYGITVSAIDLRLVAGASF